MKSFHISSIFIILLTFFSCWTEDSEPAPQDAMVVTACQPLPELEVPTGKSDKLTQDLIWLNGLHQYLEENQYSPLSVDSLSRLEAVVDTLDAHHDDDDLLVNRARAHRLIAFNLQNLDDYEGSYEILTKSLARLEESGDTSAIASYERAYHCNLISLYGSSLGEYEIGLAYNQKSMAINAKNGFVVDVIKDYLHYANIYRQIGRPDLVDNALKKGELLIENHGDCFRTNADKDVVAAYSHIRAFNAYVAGFECLAKGDTLAAERHANLAYEYVNNTKHLLSEIGMGSNPFLVMRVNMIQIQLGLQFHFLHHFRDSSLQAIQDILPLAPPESLYGSLFYFQDQLLKAQFDKSCDARETDAYQRAANYIDNASIDNIPLNFKLIHLAASSTFLSYELNCKLTDGNKARAIDIKERAMQRMAEFEAFVGSSDLELNIENIGGNWMGNYSLAARAIYSADNILHALDQPRPFSEDLLSVSDRSKSIALRLSLEKRVAYQTYDADYKALYDELSTLRQQLDAENLTPSKRIKIQADITAFFDKLRASPRPEKAQFFNDLRYFDELTLPLVRKELLTPTRAAIDIFRGSGHLYISAITEADAHQWVVPATQELAEALAGTKSRTASGNTAADDAYIIYKTALKPAIEWLENSPEIDEIIIVRDKELADFAYGYLPIEPVTGSNWTAGELLIDRYSIVYGHSLSTLIAAKEVSQTRLPTPEVAAAYLATEGITVGSDRYPPLPKMEKALSASLGGRARFITEVTSRDFLESVERYKYLAIAGHGDKDRLLDDQYYIQLLPADDSDDGRISTADLYAKSLPTSLTLLLNCESALGNSYNQEGRKSLARAFLYAGSSAVIAGNDLLSEETYPEIVRMFYHNWIRKQQAAHVALRNAKLAFRSQNSHLGPNLWGDLLYYGIPDIFYEPGTKDEEQLTRAD